MAEGDPVIVDGSIGGNTYASVSVPSGEVWCIRAFGDTYHTRLLYASTTEDSWVTMDGEGNHDAASGNMAQRPMFDSTDNPQIQNRNCSSKGYYLGGNEL
jgi:hypothetical protein